jgi:hypothetical protein
MGRSRQFIPPLPCTPELNWTPNWAQGLKHRRLGTELEHGGMNTGAGWARARAQAQARARAWAPRAGCGRRGRVKISNCHACLYIMLSIWNSPSCHISVYQLRYIKSQWISSLRSVISLLYLLALIVFGLRLGYGMRRHFALLCCGLIEPEACGARR